ncbi:hypothetical protein ANAPC1_01203 [Anaplasma phagocytophilum]|uniref:Uncharacterized protein n=1 Tax=Anaplasma phagocytophilum TaxID=948 RepID=A0AA45ZHY5_ANAPH|nr:hypothetical protein ANAPC1_01203 [Anaplasma phagocytophilum]SBO33722.1 hypothetical protein ANAPC2_01437 [Anaplasma phagocytophilum]
MMLLLGRLITLPLLLLRLLGRTLSSLLRLLIFLILRSVRRFVGRSWEEVLRRSIVNMRRRPTGIMARLEAE